MGTKAATKTGESQKGRMAVRHMAAMPYQNKGKGGITTKSRPKSQPENATIHPAPSKKVAPQAFPKTKQTDRVLPSSERRA